MLAQFNFSKGVRGKYGKRYAAGSNVVVLSRDVARIFSDSKSVNGALRNFLRITKQRRKKDAA